MGMIGLIPARAGSSRIPNKNVALLNGRPLMAYSICAALDSGICDYVIVSTDSKDYVWVAEKYGAQVIMRPPEFAGDLSPDIDWVKHALKEYFEYPCYAILRPTSPFRTAETIKRAWDLFINSDCDSIRAVEKCSQHPYKMWEVDQWGYMNPFVKSGKHSMPYQALPEIYIQNASLEISWRNCVTLYDSISGNKVKPFFTEGYEGYDINTLYDLKYAEWLAETGRAKLPEIRIK